MKIDTNNPYVGLRPFNVDESLLFFGRNDQTTEILQRLHQHHFVAIVGGSGSGKSSILRAGVIPALKAGYLVEYSDHWIISIMKPGQSPLYNLTEAILLQLDPSVTKDDINQLLKKIEENGAGTLLELMNPVWKTQKSNFFLLVDQFEELFRFGLDQKDIKKNDEDIDFVNILLELIEQNDVPFYAVITMRSDFIGDCVQFTGLPEAMNQSQYLVPRLNRIQLKVAIEGPAKLYGTPIDPALTSKMLNDLNKIKDELPLLQHALMRIWDFEINSDKNGELDLQDYDTIGGIEMALSNHADEALAGMTEEELKITEKLFQALTAIDDNGRKIRRPAKLSQLQQLTRTNREQLLHIINLFIKDKRSLLILVDQADGSQDALLDISHESLIRQWNKLNKWVDEEAESASTYLHLAESAKQYKLGKKDLLSGIELQNALEWFSKTKPLPLWTNRYSDGFEDCKLYLDKSEAAEIDRERKEISRKRNLRILTTVIMSLLLLVAAGAITILIIYGKKTDSEAKALVKEQEAEAIRAKYQFADSILKSLNTAVKDFQAGDTAYFISKVRIIQMQKSLQNYIGNTNTNTTVVDITDPSIDSTSTMPVSVNGTVNKFNYTAAQLQQVMPNASLKDLGEFIAAINRSIDTTEINTPLRFAAFTAVVAVECAEFKRLVSTYSMRETDSLYANRLGNGDIASGDAWKYRGRGVILLTGKYNYAYCTNYSDYNVLDNPDQLASIEVSTPVAGIWWKKRGINKLADTGDIAAITKRVTGSTLWLAKRKEYYNKALVVLRIKH